MARAWRQERMEFGFEDDWRVKLQVAREPLVALVEDAARRAGPRVEFGFGDDWGLKLQVVREPLLAPGEEAARRVGSRVELTRKPCYAGPQTEPITPRYV